MSQDNDDALEWIEPLVFSTSTDPGLMYIHEAMRTPDKKEFIKAMQKEINADAAGVNWVIVDRASVPEGHDILPSVWAMWRKRDIASQQLYKWKARINIHGGKQKHGINYWDTYAPVAPWASIRININMAALKGWSTKQLDFVLAIPQAPVETELYMTIPPGFTVNGGAGEIKDKVLNLVNNLYGSKQAGRV